MRAVLCSLVVVFALQAKAAPQSEPESIRVELASGQADRAQKAVDRILAGNVVDASLALPLVELMLGDPKARPSRALEALARQGEPGLETLMTVIREGRRPEGWRLVPVVAEAFGEASAPALFELIGKSDADVEFEAIRALVRVGAAFEGPMLKLLERQQIVPAGESEADAAVRRHRVEGLLSFAAMRRLDGAFGRVLDYRRNGPKESIALCENLLRRQFRKETLEIARPSLADGKDPNPSFLLRLVADEDRPEDRGLGIEQWVRTAHPPEDLLALVRRVERASRDWLGLIDTIDAESGLEASVELQGVLSRKNRSFPLSAGPGEGKSELLRVVSLDLPLARFLAAPIDGAAGLESQGENPVLSLTFTAPQPCLFGVGHERFRIWFGRGRIMVARARIEIEARRGLPLRSSWFEADGKPIGSAVFDDWIELGPDRFAPGSIRIDAAGFRFRVTARQDAAIDHWHVDSGSIRRDRTDEKGQVLDELISEFRTQDWKRRSPPPR